VANVSAVIFDYYETLAQLASAERERTFDELALRCGLSLPSGEAYAHWRERTTRDAIVRFGSGGRPPLDGEPPPFVPFRDVWLHRSEELFREWGVDAPSALGADAYRDAHVGARLYSDALSAIKALREQYGLAVLSDADVDFLQGSLARNALRIDIVVASEDVRAYKPHVSMFREVCARLGVQPSQAVYVGDSPWADIEGARHAGLRAVWLNRHGTEWPHDLEPPETTIASLSELAGLLR